MSSNNADNPIYAPFFAVMGASSAIIFSCEFLFSQPYKVLLQHFVVFFTGLGAAYGTAKSGTGIAAMSVMRPDLIMKSVIPVIMAGILAIYGLVVSVLIGNGRECSHQ